MRSVVLCILLFGLSQLLTTAQGQSISAGRVVALDQGSVGLLEACCPRTDFDCLVISDDESFETLTLRAWSMRDASCLIYRSDKISMISQLFRERLIAQGVPAIDLASYARERNAQNRVLSFADSREEVISSRDSYVLTLAIDQFRKAKTSDLAVLEVPVVAD